MPGSSEATTYEAIRNLIMTGEIPPGTALTERAIADQLGVSRVPVREAFQRLTLEGLLVNRDGKGLYTKTFNEQDILDLYAYREALDGLATRLFTIRAEQLEVRYVAMVFSEMEKAVEEQNDAVWLDRDLEFHTTIARGARNERLVRALSNIYQECFYLDRVLPHTGVEASQIDSSHIESVLEEHRTILKAIQSGDESAAEDAARESVRAATERLMASFAERSRSGLRHSAGEQ